MAVDPVALVQAPSTRITTFRCGACGVRQTLERQLPVGGVPCGRCGETFRVTDEVTYASFSLRVLALFVDGLALFAIVSTITVLAFYPVAPFIPTNEEGDVTREAAITIAAMLVASGVLYFLVTQIAGDSIGKHAFGIRIVSASTWRRPHPAVGVLRLAGVGATIATLGLGYLIMLFDAERRTLHDRVSGTRVIER